MEKDAKIVPFFYKERKRTQRWERSFEKNGCPTLTLLELRVWEIFLLDQALLAFGISSRPDLIRSESMSGISTRPDLIRGESMSGISTRPDLIT